MQPTSKGSRRALIICKTIFRDPFFCFHHLAILAHVRRFFFQWDMGAIACRHTVDSKRSVSRCDAQVVLGIIQDATLEFRLNSSRQKKRVFKFPIPSEIIGTEQVDFTLRFVHPLLSD
jgi:hypothetical protein